MKDAAVKKGKFLANEAMNENLSGELLSGTLNDGLSGLIIVYEWANYVK